MASRVSVAAAAVVALVGADRSAFTDATTASPGSRVRQIAVATLRDVAVAVYHPVHPIIAYNPAHLECQPE